MDGVMRQAVAEQKQAAVGVDAVMSQAEAEAAVAMDGLVSQTEAEATC